MSLDLGNKMTEVTAEEPSYLETAWGLTAGSLVAGVKDIGDSIGMIGEAVGFTSAYERSDTRAVIADYAGDSAAAFYDRNPHLVEGAGLLAGSIVPGSLGIKALRAAQAAEASVLGRMLQLPVSSLKTSREAAQASMLASDSIYTAINGNTKGTSRGCG